MEMPFPGKLESTWHYKLIIFFNNNVLNLI